MKRVILSLLLFVLPGLPPLEAHAFLKRAEPSVGSTVRTSPVEVRIWFTEKIGSGSIQIVDTSNKQLDKRNARVDRTDQSLLRVSLQPLQPGTYKVLWRVVSLDTHGTKGNFTFQVAP